MLVKGATDQNAFILTATQKDLLRTYFVYLRHSKFNIAIADGQLSIRLQAAPFTNMV